MSKHLPPEKNKHVMPKAAKKPVIPAEDGAHSRDGLLSDRARGVIELLLAAALLLLIYILPLSAAYKTGLYALPWLLGGFRTVKKAVTLIIGGRLLREESMLVLASLMTFGAGFEVQAVIMIILSGVCRMLSDSMDDWSERQRDGLHALLAASARIDSEHGIEQISSALVVEGDTLLVRPGERISADGVVLEGDSAVDPSPFFSAESACAVAKGSRVYAGCVNLVGNIRVRAERDFDSSVINGSLHELFESKNGSGTELALIRAGRMIPVLAFIASVLTAVFIPALKGEWLKWLARASVILVAVRLGMLTEFAVTVFEGGLMSAFRHGAVVKGSENLEKLAKCTGMVFSKSGTVTENRCFVTDVFPVGMDERELLSIAAAAESRSSHPVAQAIIAAAGIYTQDYLLDRFEELPGRGVCAMVGGKRVYVGVASFFEENGLSFEYPSRTGIVIHVWRDGRYCGHIILNDKARDGAFDSLEALRAQGVKSLVMLTGDTRSAARPIASSLNFDLVKTELMQEGKQSAVEYLMATKADRSCLAYVISGVNDIEVAPRADIGISVNAAAYPEAMEQVEIYIPENDIRRLPTVKRIANRTASAARAGLYATLAVKLLCLALGLAGAIAPLAAILAETLLAALYRISLSIIYKESANKKSTPKMKKLSQIM